MIDSFIDVRTGPGRAYPVFYVIEQGETIAVLTHRAGWYEVRAASGKVGWATAAQLSRTLQAGGEPADLPTISFGDYLKHQWRVGFTSGRFNSGELGGADKFSAASSYRVASWLGLEAELGRFFNSGFEGDFYNANILIEPFSHWRYSPELLLGRGVMSVQSQPELTPLGIDNSHFTNYGLGVNYYLGRNFVIRSEYRWYSVSTTNEKAALQSWTLGFNTFF
ncbi:MAG: SH3 domain-containing protein [Cellvibrionaceae bacterium]|nr:SH3 domain-containing protein [Cellvibrionaceae bacterium]